MSSASTVALESLVCWSDDVFIEYDKKGHDVFVVALFNDAKSFGFWFDTYGYNTKLPHTVSPRLDGSVSVCVALVPFVRSLARLRLSLYAKDSSFVEK